MLIASAVILISLAFRSFKTFPTNIKLANSVLKFKSESNDFTNKNNFTG